MPEYQIVVGNLGTVYESRDGTMAWQAFDEYVRASKRGYGHPAGEPVTMLKDDEVVQEYVPEGYEENPGPIHESGVHDRGELVRLHGAKGYFSDPTGLVGVRSGGTIWWYRWMRDKGYQLAGSTDTPQGADYRRIF